MASGGPPPAVVYLPDGAATLAKPQRPEVLYLPNGVATVTRPEAQPAGTPGTGLHSAPGPSSTSRISHGHSSSRPTHVDPKLQPSAVLPQSHQPTTAFVVPAGLGTPQPPPPTHPFGAPAGFSIAGNPETFVTPGFGSGQPMKATQAHVPPPQPPAPHQPPPQFVAVPTVVHPPPRPHQGQPSP
eukprot:EG_transcript_35531